MNEEDRMVDTFTRLFRQVYQAAGLMWTDDQTADIADLVASIYRVPDCQGDN